MTYINRYVGRVIKYKGWLVCMEWDRRRERKRGVEGKLGRINGTC